MNKLILFFLMALASMSHSSQSKTPAKPVIVIVHGAWGGAWAFREVDSLLTAKGYTVYRPTLTGQGERVHLASPEIGLNTHIEDVVNTFLYEDLHDVVLVGHSYGGMVITGVADSLPGRISKMIYVDAFVPENGESVERMREGKYTRMPLDGNGGLVPPWVPPGQKPPSDVPHPYKTFVDRITLKNPLRSEIPAVFILTVDRGTDAAADDFAFAAQRAREKGWPVLQLEGDHNPQWSAPEAFADLLDDVCKE